MFYALVFAFLLMFPLQAIAETVNASLSVKQAERLITDNNPEEALKVLSKYKPGEKELSSYHYIFSKAFEKAGKFHDAVTHLRLSYLYATEQQEKERLLLERSELYLEKGYYPEAATTYRQFLRYFSKSNQKEKARLGLADALCMQGLFIEALLNYEEAGVSPRAILGKANVYQYMGRVSDANKLYMSVAGSLKDFIYSSPETQYNLGENLRLSGRPAEAKAYYEAIKDPIVRKKAEMGLGLIAMDEAKYDAAISLFKSAAEALDRKTRVKALLYLSDAYQKTGKSDEAKKILMEIQRNFSYTKDYEIVLLKLVRLYKNEGKFNEAVNYLKELASRKALSKEAVDEFESIILEAMNDNSDNFIKLWNAFGRLLLDPQRSKALVQISAGLRPSGKPFLELCTWLVKNGSPEARTQCSVSLADFYADIGDAARASEHIRNAKGISDEILRVKAKVLMLKKDYQKAMQTILSVKELKPNDIVFFAELLESSKDMNKSVDFCEEALKNIGAPLKVYIKLADTLHRMGRESDALKFYRIVAALKPETRKDLTSEDAGWTYYMISKLSGEGKSPEMNPVNGKTGNIYSKSAEAAMKEAGIQERMKRLF